ncbi:hypothetical protein VZT92_010333 [Zoarces viviparus]|uniref:Secreted protein n=1 Tax=Zoarces viviparus TaxID=48416 RepID=A0AAW1FET7_ZOAVI
MTCRVLLYCLRLSVLRLHLVVVWWKDLACATFTRLQEVTPVTPENVTSISVNVVGSLGSCWLDYCCGFPCPYGKLETDHSSFW